MRSVTDLYAPVEPQPDEPAPRKRRTVPLIVGVVAATLLVVGIVVAASGSDDSDTKVKDPIALLSSAPDALRDKGSAHLKATMAMQVAGHDVSFVMDGATEFATNRGTFTMSVFGQTFDFVSDGETVYVHLPEMLRGSSTAEWVAIPAKAGGFTGTMDSTTGFLEALRGVAGDVREVGTEDVNGVSTTHYQATIDLQKALDAVPDAQREQARAGLDQLGTGSMPVDVWLSSDGIPVRMVLTMDAPQGAGLLGGSTMRMTLDLTDFGAPVDVQVPPEDQVQRMDDPSKLGGMFGGAGGAGAGTTD